RSETIRNTYMHRSYLGVLEKASNDTPRDINRRLAFDLIRRLQPVSRADLARASGLQRSTISLIVEQLIAAQWVVEGSLGFLPMGRRPTLLQLSERRAVVVVDVHPGRANIAIGSIDGSLGAQIPVALSNGAKEGSRQLASAIKKLMKAHPERLFHGIGMSLPGGVDDAQRLIFAPNLNWLHCDIQSVLQRATGLPVEIENAANISLLGELWFRGANEARHLALVAVAEGIGVGVVSNGLMVRGMNGLAGEIGHLTLDEDGPACHCGARGCWETYASNRAAERYYKTLRGRASGASFEELLRLADQGDGLAVQALEQMAFQLGRGLRILTTAYSPEAIIISGELTAQWKRFAPILESALRRHTLAGSAPKLVPSNDGALSRLRGGIALVLQR
ncbi:MAG: ROK family protein, partial [Acidobacteriaceae bacterium]